MNQVRALELLEGICGCGNNVTAAQVSEIEKAALCEEETLLRTVCRVAKVSPKMVEILESNPFNRTVVFYAVRTVQRVDKP